MAIDDRGLFLYSSLIEWNENFYGSMLPAIVLSRLKVIQNPLFPERQAKVMQLYISQHALNIQTYLKALLLRFSGLKVDLNCLK